MADPLTDDDATLVARCREGDAAAWAVLVKRYQRLVYAIVMRAGLDEHTAADVFQTVFSRLVQHLSRLTRPDRLQAWIVTTAKREALLARRLAQRNVSMTRDDDDAQAPSFEDELADESPLAEQQLSELQQLDLLRNGLDRLDGRCRAQVTRGQMQDAVRSFDSAATAFRALGKADEAAQTQVPKIMALSMLGQHDEAAHCAESTQRELRGLGNLRAASRVSLNLGGALLRRDAYAQAVPHYREAAVLFARVGDQEHSVIADIGLADALTSLGDFDEAVRIYARARMRAGNQGFEMLLALIDESQALVELARGRYREALAGFESARRRYQVLALPQYLAIAEKQLGDAYLELRLLPEAQALFDTAVAQFGQLARRRPRQWVSRGRPRIRGARLDAAFIDEDDQSALGGTLFLSAGQVLRFHASTAASLRSYRNPRSAQLISQGVRVAHALGPSDQRGRQIDGSASYDRRLVC